MAHSDPKQQAHDLIERMAPGQVAAVVDLLEVMLDPLSRTLASAPLDDEPVSEEEATAVAASRDSLERNQSIPHEEVLAEFGLRTTDFERTGRTPVEPHRSDR